MCKKSNIPLEHPQESFNLNTHGFFQERNEFKVCGRAGHWQWKNWATTDTYNKQPAPDFQEPAITDNDAQRSTISTLHLTTTLHPKIYDKHFTPENQQPRTMTPDTLR
jgi:hypothetical protein